MLNNKKQLLFFISAVVLTVLFVCSISFDVYAGDINSDEARVIGVASGTFSYEGKVYKAYSSYVNDLYAYMSQDDVNLSADQADRAINYIYANVATGISSGYVYEVVQEEDNNSDLDQIIPELKEDGQWEEYQAVTGNNGVDSQANSEAARETARDASDREVDNMFGDIDQSHEKEATHSDKSVASDTDASLVMTDNDIVIKNGDDSYVIDKYTRIIPSFCGTILVALAVFALAISFIIFLLLSIYKCFRFSSKDKAKVKKGHHKRKKVRKISKYLLTVTGGISFIFLFVDIALLIGFFDNAHIIQNIQNSGYFRYAYMNYITSSVSDNEGNDKGKNIGNNEIYSYDDFIVKEQISITKLEASEFSE
nr:hypothetical protein [Eubacterium sp.]